VSQNVTRRRVWVARALLVVPVLAAALISIAGINPVLVFVLFSAYHQGGRPDTGLSSFIVPMAVGAVPLLTTAALIVWTVPRGNQAVSRLSVVAGFGLPVIVVFGFWVGLYASALELPLDSPPAAALTAYQFTWLSAVLADVATLVLALLMRRGG
jgi:hypothetical protein